MYSTKLIHQFLNLLQAYLSRRTHARIDEPALGYKFRTVLRNLFTLKRQQIPLFQSLVRD